MIHSDELKIYRALLVIDGGVANLFSTRVVAEHARVARWQVRHVIWALGSQNLLNYYPSSPWRPVYSLAPAAIPEINRLLEQAAA